jgi:hypothetical protein
LSTETKQEEIVTPALFTASIHQEFMAPDAFVPTDARNEDWELEDEMVVVPSPAVQELGEMPVGGRFVPSADASEKDIVTFPVKVEGMAA